MNIYNRFRIQYQNLWVRSVALRNTGMWALQCTTKEEEAALITEFDAIHLGCCIQYRAMIPDPDGAPLKFILTNAPSRIPGGDKQAFRITEIPSQPPALLKARTRSPE